MNSNKFLLPVQISSEKPDYPSIAFNTKDELEQTLSNKAIPIKLGGILKGGVVSQVYTAELDGKSVVVKHTENIIPFDPTEFFISKNGHNIDTEILKKLSKTSIRVPKVLHHFPEITTTIMEDMRKSGFSLLQNLILDKTLTLASAKSVGKQLAQLAVTFADLEQIETNESAEQNIFERGLELRLAYPNDQEEYIALEQEYISKNDLTWPDGHPKNMLMNEQGDVVFIDFGRCHYGDQRYMLPNFLAHIVLYSIAGYIDNKLAKQYLVTCMEAYRSYIDIEEKLFCQYLAMEVLHRSNGKWIQGVETREQKLKLFQFGLTVFDTKIETIESLLKLLD